MTSDIARLRAYDGRMKSMSWESEVESQCGFEESYEIWKLLHEDDDDD
jgi:hypothetical protein